MKLIRIVCATRLSAEKFYQNTALGKSLSFFSTTNFPFIEHRLFPDNTSGLSAVYNIAIDESINNPAILVFVHDDVWLCDYFWPKRIIESVDNFQLTGIVGNKRRVSRQPSWLYSDDNFTIDSQEYLSGIVAHGSCFPPRNINFYGPSCQHVKLLDGLLLFCNSSIFHDFSFRFDEQFDFHFYDLDICRQAEIKNLTVGTCSLAVIHESLNNGVYQSNEWKRNYQKYFQKWTD